MKNEKLEKQASSEIAQSREQFEKWGARELGWRHEDFARESKQFHSGESYESPEVQVAWLSWKAAERERLAEQKYMWGWPIEEIKSAMRQFQSKHPGELPSEVERAERIRGKEQVDDSRS